MDLCRCHLRVLETNPTCNLIRGGVFQVLADESGSFGRGTHVVILCVASVMSDADSNETLSESRSASAGDTEATRTVKPAHPFGVAMFDVWFLRFLSFLLPSAVLRAPETRFVARGQSLMVADAVQSIWTFHKSCATVTVSMFVGHK